MGVNKNHSVGKTIASLRKEKGWSQVELAEKLQVSDKAVSKWESDGGMPSLEFFPALAKMFGISIDYLMTGKETEPEIVTMSKIELCAKNDDIKLIENFGITTKDENGKTLLYYVKKYKSKNVLRALFDGCHQSYYYAFFEGKNPNPKQVVELLILLAEVDREIKFFGNANFNRYAYKNGIIDIQLKTTVNILNLLDF